MFNTKICEHCIKKSTTSGCITCRIYTINQALDELDDFINEHKKDLDKYIFYFNPDYRNLLDIYVKSHSILEDNIRYTYMCEFNENELGIVVDKSLFDWGNINI